VTIEASGDGYARTGKAEITRLRAEIARMTALLEQKPSQVGVWAAFRDDTGELLTAGLDEYVVKHAAQALEEELDVSCSYRRVTLSDN
jgi:hypothetical protein